MKTHPSTISHITTNRPAPMLPGFHSMQALSSSASTPSITQYHRKSESAVNWMKAMAKRKIYDTFVLSSSETHWDMFDRAGQWIEKRTSITPDSGVMMESIEPLVVDYSAYEQSAKGILGNSVSCITWAEHHAHASSVGHSNMVVVARQLVMEASDEDLSHIYFVDSIESECSVQGWFVDMSALGTRLIDKYLDRYKWLSNGWPLANDHHIQVLAYRMATLRPMEVVDALLAVGEHENLGEHKSLVATRMQKASQQQMIEFAAKMFEGLEPAVRLPSAQELEMIDEDEMIRQAPRIARLYRETFLL